MFTSHGPRHRTQAGQEAPGVAAGTAVEARMRGGRRRGPRQRGRRMRQQRRLRRRFARCSGGRRRRPLQRGGRRARPDLPGLLRRRRAGHQQGGRRARPQADLHVRRYPGRPRGRRSRGQQAIRHHVQPVILVIGATSDEAAAVVPIINRPQDRRVRHDRPGRVRQGEVPVLLPAGAARPRESPMRWSRSRRSWGTSGLRWHSAMTSGRRPSCSPRISAIEQGRASR